jgi:hypothetical protein
MNKSQLSPSEYAGVMDAWRDTWSCFSPKEKSKLITVMAEGWEKGEVDTQVYEELCDWYEAEICADEEEEEDDIVTIHPADYDEYHEDEEEEHTLSFDEDDQYYEERMDFHLDAYFNRNI